jgi:hypothetical protein
VLSSISCGGASISAPVAPISCRVSAKSQVVSAHFLSRLGQKRPACAHFPSRLDQKHAVCAHFLRRLAHFQAATCQ